MNYELVERIPDIVNRGFCNEYLKDCVAIEFDTELTENSETYFRACGKRIAEMLKIKGRVPTCPMHTAIEVNGDRVHGVIWCRYDMGDLK